MMELYPDFPFLVNNLKFRSQSITYKVFKLLCICLRSSYLPEAILPVNPNIRTFSNFLSKKNHIRHGIKVENSAFKEWKKLLAKTN